MPAMFETLSPPKLAKAWGVKVQTVHAWISSGELAAFNVGKKGKRPSWRITVEAAENFQRSRAAVKPRPVRQRRRTSPAAGEIDFFPE
jgi:hypothetical protein